MVFIESAGKTDVGKKRKSNEDALFLDKGTNLYLVADGMGGHLAGEVASSMVIDVICDHIRRPFKSNMFEESADHDEILSAEATTLLNSIYLANHKVYTASCSQKSLHGMGSTVSAVYFSDNTFIVANVGDSPIYLVHKGHIELVSVPHTVKAELEALNPERTVQPESSFGHMLTRGIGIEKTVKADICECQCFKGDIIVICSDGLSNKVSSEEILHVASRQNPDKACQILVDMANDRGGDDNITVIVIKVKKIKHKKSRIFSWFRI